MSSKRLYIPIVSSGIISNFIGATRRDVEEFFSKSGPVIDIRVLNGFGFIEFDSLRDAEAAIDELNGRDLCGEPISLQPAKDSRRREGFAGGRGDFGGPPRGGPFGGARGPPRGGRGRVIVKGLTRDVSWQDLKDFGREGGDVSYADIDRDNEGQGVIEYPTVADAEEAVRKLEGLTIRGNPISARVEADRFGAGGRGDEGYSRRDDRDRRDDRPYRRHDGRDDYRSSRRDDYYRRDDRDRDRDYRRDDRRDDYRRDRSPRRERDRDDRSPAPRRDRERDDRSPAPRRDRDDRSPAPRRDRDDRSPVRRRERSAEAVEAAPAAGGSPRASYDDRRRSRSPIDRAGSPAPAGETAAGGAPGWD